MQRIKCLLLLLTFALLAVAQPADQKGAINGTVVDENGEPMIGASLRLQKSKQGTITDAEGRFALPSSSRGDMVTISYLGYESVTVAALSR